MIYIYIPYIYHIYLNKMVQAMINIDEHTNRVLKIVKAKYELKDKSKAIDLMAQQYEEAILQPELRPEFVEKAKEIMSEKAIHVGSLEDFRKRYNMS
jgi:hypothetical protein